VQKWLNRSRCHFGLWARLCRRNHALDGGPEVLRDVAMATNFGTQFDVTGFVGYNFGCMIASDMLFDSRGGFFGVKLSDEDIAEIECLRVVAMATIFWLSIYGVHIVATWQIRLNRSCVAAMRPCRITLSTCLFCCCFTSGFSFRASRQQTEQKEKCRD